MNEQKILSEDFEMKIVEDIINQFKPRVDAKVELDAKAELDDVDDAFLDRDFYQIFQNITNTTGINEWEKRGFVNNNNRTTLKEYEMNISLFFMYI
jgi:hypothetical protein